jgi:hypothetical protein
VRRHLRPREIEAALQYRNSLGLSGFFVDEVLKAHEAERKGRARPKRARPRRPRKP